MFLVMVSRIIIHRLISNGILMCGVNKFSLNLMRTFNACNLKINNYFNHIYIYFNLNYLKTEQKENKVNVLSDRLILHTTEEEAEGGSDGFDNCLFNLGMGRPVATLPFVAFVPFTLVSRTTMSLLE